MAQQLPPAPQPVNPIVDPRTGQQTVLMAQYLLMLDQLFRGLTGGTAGLINAANDGAAAAAGVQIGQLYRNGNAVQIRLV